MSDTRWAGGPSPDEEHTVAGTHRASSMGACISPIHRAIIAGVRFDTTHTSVRTVAPSSFRHALSVVFGTGHLGHSIPIGSGWVVFGRNEGDQIVGLTDPCMSRKHARVGGVTDGAPPRVEDLGSKNGVFVNGEKVQKAELGPGDVIRLGDTLLVYEVFDPEADTSQVGGDVFVGNSFAAGRVRSEIRSAARSGMTCTILGETGAGKELLARLCHEATGRAGPLVAVNCAAIARELVESTLFGHKRGAFSGAVESSPGLFVAADGGTLFLDEVGELSPQVQAALLRTLEDSMVVPVGSTSARKVDVRVVCATHRDLEHESEEGNFRLDLWNRIGRFVVRVPPLRERRSDILTIAALHLPEARVLSADAAEVLLIAPWTGNARELITTIGRALATSPADAPLSQDSILRSLKQRSLPRPAPSAAQPESPSAGRPSEEELSALLVRHGGNIARVAEALGRTRKQIYRWLEHYKIDTEKFRGAAGDS